jgi:hypothetical protein
LSASRSWVIASCAAVSCVLAGCGQTRTIIETTPVAQSSGAGADSGPSGTAATVASSTSGSSGLQTVTASSSTASASAVASSSSAPDLTESQQNAVSAATSYLQLGGFSKQGLIDQLDSSAGDGYSVQDATVAVDSLSVDYNAEAVRSARSYLQESSFSCQGLIQQLDSSAGDQYTQAQATYAATTVGLCTPGDTDSGSTGGGNTASAGTANTNTNGYTYTATVPATTATPSKADSWPGCHSNLNASDNISCSLENNTFYEYWNAATSNKADPGFQVTVEAWADATSRYYTTLCKPATGGETVECTVEGTTGGDSAVSFPVSAVTDYTASDASAYANAHFVGPNG